MMSREPHGRRGLRAAAIMLFVIATAVQLVAGWTHALPVVDCYGWLMQVTTDPLLAAHVPASFAQLGLFPGSLWSQLGVFYAATGRGYVSYLAYIQNVARMAGQDAALWHVANVLCVVAALALLGSLLRQVSRRPWLSLALVALLFVPHAEPSGWELFGYMTSAEAPGLLYLALALRLALVAGWPAAVACSVAFAAAALSKESLIVFAPVLWALRAGVVALVPSGRIRRLTVAALPPALATVFFGGFLLALRTLYPPVGAAYAGAVGTEARSKLLATVAVSTFEVLQQFLPVAAPPASPKQLMLALMPRLALVAAGGWLAWALGWRWQGRARLQTHAREAWLVGAALLAALATLTAYWLLGRMPPSDFHLAPVAFAVVLAVAVAGNFAEQTAAPHRRWQVALIVTTLLVLAAAFQGPSVALYWTLGVALAGAGLWLVLPRWRTGAVAAALLWTVCWVPRWPLLLQDRAGVAADAERLQAAVAAMIAQPKDATVHLTIARLGWIEYAWALRGYTTLRGRPDLRICLSVEDEIYAAGNVGYVRRLTDTFKADDTARPVTPVTLSVAVRTAAVGDPDARPGGAPKLGATVATGPATPCIAGSPFLADAPE